MVFPNSAPRLRLSRGRFQKGQEWQRPTLAAETHERRPQPVLGGDGPPRRHGRVAGQRRRRADEPHRRREEGVARQYGERNPTCKPRLFPELRSGEYYYVLAGIRRNQRTLTDTRKKFSPGWSARRGRLLPLPRTDRIAPPGSPNHGSDQACQECGRLSSARRRASKYGSEQPRTTVDDHECPRHTSQRLPALLNVFSMPGLPKYLLHTVPEILYNSLPTV